VGDGIAPGSLFVDPDTHPADEALCPLGGSGTHYGGKVPHPQKVGGRFELGFSRAQAAADVECGAEWSPDLQSGSWRDVPDTGNGDEHVISLPVDTAPRLFMRLRVCPGANP